MKEKKTSHKPILFYAVLAAILILMLNALVFPKLAQSSQVTEVDYGTFLRYIEEGKVKTVEVRDEESLIAFLALDDSGEEKVYITTAMDDPGLVERLYNQEPPIQFSRVLPEESSPLISFLLTWILPSILFYLLGVWLMRSMQKRIPGVTFVLQDVIYRFIIPYSLSQAAGI